MKGLTRDKINALGQIAAVDGHIADEEKAIINKIAAENGFNEQDVTFILDNPEPIGDFSDMTKDEKLEFMFLSLSVMQADDWIFNSEIDFCKSLAIRLGIDTAIVDVYGTRSDIGIDEFMEKAQRYVKE